MKRTISTVVLFVLLILTVVALTRIGSPKSARALSPNISAAAQGGTH